MKKNTDARRKKGATLAELCVVIAIAAIVSVMVVSFSTLASNRVDTFQERANINSEIALVEAMTEGWIVSTTEGGATPESLADTPPVIYEDRLYFTEELSVPVDYVKSIKLTVMTQEGDALYVVTLTYRAVGGKEATYTFCVNPYIGDVIGEGTP